MFTDYFYGFADLSFWGYVAVVLGLTHITMICVTVYLHRHSAHRALNLHPILSHFFRFWLWMTTGMVTKEWTAVHRKHHAHCETEADPHSPQIFGLSKVLFEGAELYRKESHTEETLTRYGAGTPDDWMERNVYTKRSSLGVKLMLLTNVFLFGVPGFAIWGIQMAWSPIFAAGIVNGIGHYFGYRNFECQDASKNFSPWGILIAGEELHNNHHTYPTSAKLSVRWWEFDIGWMYITLFSWAGLAQVKRAIPEPMQVSKSQFDLDTLGALLSNRFHVMSKYAHLVLLPALKEQQKRASDVERGLLKKIRSALVREPSLLSSEAQTQLQKALEAHPSLEHVMRFKERLQEIWDQTAASNKDLLEALHQWSKDAEASGISFLNDFCAYIRGYALKANA